MTTKSKVYSFYAIVIGVCILALLFIDFNIYAKAVICTLIVLFICVIRSVKNASVIPDDIDPDTMEKVPDLPHDVKEGKEKKKVLTTHNDIIDEYLEILIEEDELLCAEPGIDQTSPSYNNILNERINKRLTDRL